MGFPIYQGGQDAGRQRLGAARLSVWPQPEAAQRCRQLVSTRLDPIVGWADEEAGRIAASKAPRSRPSPGPLSPHEPGWCNAMKPHDEHTPPNKGVLYYLATPVRWFFSAFNWGFERLSNGYGAMTARFVRLGFIFLIIYGGLLGLTYWRLIATPTELIPQLDRTYFIAAFQLPPGSTLNRTDEVVRQASDILLTRPGVEAAVAFVGFDGATFTNAPNTGVIFVRLKSFEERAQQGLSKDGILADLREQMGRLRQAYVFVLEPPSVPGIGTGGGLKGYVQDRAGRGLPELEKATWAVAGTAARHRVHASLHTLQHAHAADLCRYRPHQGGKARRAHLTRVRARCRSTWAPPLSTTSTFSGGRIA